MKECWPSIPFSIRLKRSISWVSVNKLGTRACCSTRSFSINCNKISYRGSPSWVCRRPGEIPDKTAIFLDRPNRWRKRRIIQMGWQLNFRILKLVWLSGNPSTLNKHFTAGIVYSLCPNSHSVGLDSWPLTALKSILWMNLFLNKLHIFCYISQIL